MNMNPGDIIEVNNVVAEVMLNDIPSGIIVNLSGRVCLDEFYPMGEEWHVKKLNPDEKEIIPGLTGYLVMNTDIKNFNKVG